MPFRFFVLNLTADPEQKDQERVFINPQIVKRHSSLEDEEGCLSFPGLYSKVRRARKIRVKAFDLQGEEIDLEAEELLGRAIQHETDHLSGKLFIDYLGPISRHSASAKLKEFEAKYRQAQAAGEVPDDAELTATPPRCDDLAVARAGPAGKRGRLRTRRGRERGVRGESEHGPLI